MRLFQVIYNYLSRIQNKFAVIYNSRFKKEKRGFPAIALLNVTKGKHSES